MNADRAALLWQRLHAALDQRRDPLDDADVQAALLADEAALDGYARLVEGLRAVPLARRRSVHVRRLILALSAAAAVAAAWLLWARGAPPLPPLGEPCRLLRLHVARADDGGERSLELQPGGGRVHRVRAAPRGPLLRHSVATTKPPLEPRPR